MKVKVRYIGEYMKEAFFGLVAEVEPCDCDGAKFYHYVDGEGDGWAWMPDEVEIVSAE